MAGDDVNIRVTATTAQASRAFKEFKSEVGGLRGTLIPLATAAAPLAAAMAPIAAKAAGAGVAVAAFGAAVAGQVSHLSDAADAQDKYTDTVAKYGRGSKQAAEAQRMLSATLSTMPQATARAAVGLQTLKTDFKGWSDELAGFTMSPVEKGFALLDQLIPKLTPMVKGASTQFDRLISVAGGAMATPGFDALANKVSSFANESLREATNGIIHFARALSEGDASGPLKTFMEYAAKNGPALRETLRNVGEAVMTLVKASSEAGPGMLTLVNAAAKLVASMPPELVARIMQAAVALKAMKLAGAGFAVLSTGLQTFAARLAAMRAASVAAGGGLTGLRAAVGTLSTSMKAGAVIGGLALVAVGIKELASKARGAPPDVDKLTTSLKGLASTGKFTGELRKTFGDVDGLVDKIKLLNKETAKSKETAFGFRIPGLDDLADSLAGSINDMTKGDKSLNALKDDFSSLDKAMAGLVASGHGDAAAKDFETIKTAALAQGHSLKEVNALLPEYNSALADSAYEQKLTADSMGIFGQAAQDTSAKLKAQQQSADGLRQSILALNDANRSAYDAQIGFEASLDDLTESFKKNGATLDLNTEKGRANGEAMSKAAKSQDDFIAAGVAAGDSLTSMTKKSDELRSTMLKLATEAFDGNKQKAQEYVNTLLGTPADIRTLVKLEQEKAKQDIDSFNAAVKKTPGAKSITLDTLSAAAEQKLKSFGFKVERLPDGHVKITAGGNALSMISSVTWGIARLDGKSATTTITSIHNIITNSKTYRSVHDIVGATGGLFTGRGFRYSDGGLVQGPGTGTSDDIPAPFLSNGEFVIKAASVRKYGEKFLQRLNDGQVDAPRFAKGGKVKMSPEMKQARSDLTKSFGISHFGTLAGYRRDSFEKGLGAPSDLNSLVSSLNDAAGKIKAAFSGRTESNLLKHLNSVGKSLINHEKQLTKVNESLGKAKDKLNSLKDSASQLSSSVKSSLIGSANITRGASGEGTVTLASVRSGLTASRDKVTAFANALKQLKSKGYSKSIIQQVAEAGIDGGGLEAAGALLQASASEVASINTVQGQIEKAAGAAGKTTADAVYAKAIKDQTAVVNKLTKQQDKLEKSMASLAKSMEKLIQKALKGKAAGGIVGAAASGGLRSGLTLVGEQGPELAELAPGTRVWSNPDTRRMAAAPWASMLNTPRRAPGAAAAAPAGRPEPIVIELRSSGSETDEFLLKILRRAIRVRGGNVNVVLTGRP